MVPAKAAGSSLAPHFLAPHGGCQRLGAVYSAPPCPCQLTACGRLRRRPAAKTSLDRMMDHGGERNPVRYASLANTCRRWMVMVRARYTAAWPQHRSSVPRPPPAAIPPARSRSGSPGRRPLPRPTARLACIPACAGVSKPDARTSPLPNWPQRDTLRRSPRYAEQIFCAPRVAVCLSFRRHSYSAIRNPASQRCRSRSATAAAPSANPPWPAQTTAS